MINPPVVAPAKSSAATPYGTLALLLIVSRLVVLLIAWLSLYIINKSTFFSPADSVLDWFQHWDAGWYLSIAKDGYSFKTAAQSSVAFFPFYPLLIGVFSPLLGGPVVAGYLISNFALYGVLVFLWKWVYEEYADGDLATNTCWYLLIGPVSFFFSTIYTESLFLFFCLTCLHCGRKRQWLLAGLLGYCASLTRNIGVFLFLPLVWEYYSVWRATEPSNRKLSLYSVVCCLLPSLGLISFMGYLWYAFNDPLAFTHVQATWGRRLSPFWDVFLPHRIQNMHPFFAYWFVGTVAVTLIAIILGVWLRLRRVSLLLIVGPLFLYLSSHNLESIPRYISVLFPLYLIAALLARKSALLDKIMTAVSLSMLALSTIQFVNGYWFT